MSTPYHHGNLRSALLDEAACMVDEGGVGSISLRELARRTGVSHGAPAHHFRDRRGLLTALASQSLTMLADNVRAATPWGFEEAAVAYIQFARQHPGRYAVMYNLDLLDITDAELADARSASMEALLAGVESIPSRRRPNLTTDEAAHVAWSLVHGLASLELRNPAWGSALSDDFTRRAAQQLFN